VIPYHFLYGVPYLSSENNFIVFTAAGKTIRNYWINMFSDGIKLPLKDNKHAFLFVKRYPDFFTLA